MILKKTNIYCPFLSAPKSDSNKASLFKRPTRTLFNGPLTFLRFLVANIWPPQPFVQWVVCVWCFSHRPTFQETEFDRGCVAFRHGCYDKGKWGKYSKNMVFFVVVQVDNNTKLVAMPRGNGKRFKDYCIFSSVVDSSTYIVFVITLSLDVCLIYKLAPHTALKKKIHDQLWMFCGHVSATRQKHLLTGFQFVTMKVFPEPIFSARPCHQVGSGVLMYNTLWK